MTLIRNSLSVDECFKKFTEEIIKCQFIIILKEIAIKINSLKQAIIS